MITGWDIKPVGDVCTIVGGGTPSRANAAFFGGSIPWATIRDMKSDWIESTEFSITPAAVKASATHVLPAGTVIVASRVGLGKVARSRNETAINQDLRGFIPKSASNLDPHYLFLWFKSVADRIVAAGNGATVQGVTLPFLRSLEIPLPPIEEQRRIVAVLDEAFAAIAIATANAEKNLANARELFDSELNASFATVQAGWQQGCLADIMDIAHGFAFKGEDFASSDDITKPVVLTPGNYTEDAEITYTSRNTKRLIRGVPPSSFKFDAGDLTVVMTDLSSKMKILGRPAFVEGDGVLHNQRIGKVIFRNTSVEPRLVYYAMQTAAYLSRIRDTATGTMVRHTAPKRILANAITYPSDKGGQRALVERLDRVRSQAKTLRKLQLEKIKALAALKQSLLHRAFNGELTDTRPNANDNDFVTPAFTANVIAFAYCLHVALCTENTFGRVKAQKALHLCESIGGINLGRRPMKDAAGPNDFQHMLAAEDWAKANQFFQFELRRTGNGYTFKKLARFDMLIADGMATLKPVQDRLEKAIGLITRMNSQQAELLTTVHAAWNNLILDGTDPTDAAIVHEARENWHADKLKIAEAKFHDVIRTIRTKRILPDGTGKRVGGQERLF